MNSNYTLLFLSLAFFLSSCDCVNSIEGTIVDEKNLPLKEVHAYYVIDGKIRDSMITGDDGRYVLSKISGICNPKENDIILLKNDFHHVVLNELEVDRSVVVLMANPKENTRVDEVMKLYQQPEWTYYYNLLIILFNSVSFGFVFTPRIKMKALWVILFVVVNPYLTIVRTTDSMDLDVVGFILNPHFTGSLWLMFISIPLVPLSFWIYFIYLKSKKTIVKGT
ncbi:MAG: hypothetical protein JWM14_2117 [Chitinophagaceae bacterium]|nr:hypothetical protein [Chitinophagaceae bacterium]